MSNQLKLDRGACVAKRAPVDLSFEPGSKDSTDALESLIEEYGRTGRAAHWPVPSSLQSSILMGYRNSFIQTLAKKSVPEILESYIYVSVADMKRLLALSSKYLLTEPLRGVGLELGGGSGLLASVVASRPEVRAVLIVELCERAVDLLIPKVSSWVLGEEAKKVVPVVGTFDDLHLPSNSIDFAVEIDSFHHSDNLEVTFSECARVLKPGGRLLCFDRIWPDSHPDHDLEKLRARLFPSEFLVAHGYPPDLVLSRREFGEHEYKLFEWRAAVDAAGFELVRICKFWQGVPFRLALKGALSVLPASLRRMMYKTDNATLKTSRLWLAQQLKKAALIGQPAKSLAALHQWPQQNLFAPRETTAFLLRKRLH